MKTTKRDAQAKLVTPRLFDAFRYLRDHSAYSAATKNLFWYKKHRGYAWFRGQNFGDYLSKVIVGEIARRRGYGGLRKTATTSSVRLFAIGSILHFAQNGDTIWGSGVNGKIPEARHEFSSLDVRMVRGPLTRDFLQARGIDVPPVYGDPALVLPTLFPQLRRHITAGKAVVIPNLNEFEQCRSGCVWGDVTLVSPLCHWTRVVAEILSAEVVSTSSLHGIILAEAFAVPVRFFAPFGGETLFKYSDYYLGTGRTPPEPTATLEQGIDPSAGVEMPPPTIRVEPMLEAFPDDLFV